jgi:hypothetical protein
VLTLRVRCREGWRVAPGGAGGADVGKGNSSPDPPWTHPAISQLTQEGKKCIVFLDDLTERCNLRSPMGGYLVPVRVRSAAQGMKSALAQVRWQ